MSKTDRTGSKSVGTIAPGIRQHVPVAGGTLVYEGRELGRELVGFVDVTDWDDLAEALAARDLARGHIYHLPEFDA